MSKDIGLARWTKPDGTVNSSALRSMLARGLCAFILLYSNLGIAAPVATTLYDNGGPNLSLFGGISDISSSTIVAENFVLSVDATVTHVQWWGGYRLGVTPALDDFRVQIIETNTSTGAPVVTPLAEISVGDVGRNFIGTDQTGFAVYEYNAELAATSVVANTTYWLSIVNNTPMAVNTDDWFWERSSSCAGTGCGLIAWDGVPFGEWELITTAELAFNLSGTAANVPEPATLALVGIGLAGIGCGRRRLKKP